MTTPRPALHLGDQPVVKFKKLTPTASIPTRATPYAAGLDLYADEEVMLASGERYMVRTGVAIETPAGYEGQVRPRSGLAAKAGVTVVNTPGTVDEDYRGEIKIVLINHGSSDFWVRPGDRIAQLVIAPVVYARPVEVEELTPAPTRGDRGFGSTGA